MNTSYSLLHYNTHTTYFTVLDNFTTFNFTVHISFTNKVHFKCFSDGHHSRCLKSQMWTGFCLKFGSLLKLFTTIKRSVLFIWCHFLFFILCSLPPFLCWTFKDIIINMLHYIQADARGQQHKAGGKLLICGFLALHDLPT